MALNPADGGESIDLSGLPLSEADIKAHAGDIRGLESIWQRHGKSSTTARTLDLLARIAIQNGQFSEARRFWGVALAADPGNKAAVAALSRLNSSWLLFALAKRSMFLIVLSSLLFLAIVGGWSLVRGHFAIFNDKPLVVASDPASASGNALIRKTEKRQSMGGSTQSPPSSVAGFATFTDRGDTRFVPNDALFLTYCQFSGTARTQLAQIAIALKTQVRDYAIVIEGRADSDPLSARSKYQDNYELGLYRALAVEKVLRVHGGFPVGSLLIASAGDNNPLFPGKDSISKLRNRTATIRLVPKMTASRT